MSRYFSFLTAVLLLAACSGQGYTKAPIMAPDRSKQHKISSCPFWNDTFVGQSTKRTIKLHMGLDRKGAMLMEDVGVDHWVVDGQGHNSGNNRFHSYVAYCAPSTSTDGAPAPLVGTGNLTIEGYDSSGQKTFTILFAPLADGSGFQYSHVDGTGTALEAPDTFTKLAPSK
jgi:hypothetical protein